MNSDIDRCLMAWESASSDTWRRAWGVPQLMVFEDTTSTNDVLRRLADAGAAKGTTVIAEHQTAGRGQGGRRWNSPAGKSLLLSVLLRSDDDTADVTDPSTTPIRVGLALCRAIAAVARIDVGIKWPNDIVHNERKLAGILCEGASGRAGGFVVAGIGINVAQAEADWPEELRTPATSLRLITGHDIARAELAGAILHSLRPFRLLGDLDDRALAEFRARDALHGRRVVLEDQSEAVARGIDARGALLVQSDGGIRTIRSGSVRIAPQA